MLYNPSLSDFIYILKVEQRISEERERALHYLDKGTEARIVDVSPQLLTVVLITALGSN